MGDRRVYVGLNPSHVPVVERPKGQGSYVEPLRTARVLGVAAV